MGLAIGSAGADADENPPIGTDPSWAVHWKPSYLLRLLPGAQTGAGSPSDCRVGYRDQF